MKRLITRCRGGAIASTVLTRAISNHDYDMQISSVDEIFALSAIKLIENGDVVYLDPNMSSKNLAMCFSEHLHVKLLTNGVNVAKKVAEIESIEVTFIGGKLCPKTMGFYGYQAENQLKNYRLDKSILAVDKFDFEVGITEKHADRAGLIQSVCKNSNEIVVICKSVNLGKSHCYIAQDSKKISILITDKDIKREQIDALTAFGIKVIIAK